MTLPRPGGRSECRKECGPSEAPNADLGVRGFSVPFLNSFVLPQHKSSERVLASQHFPLCFLQGPSHYYPLPGCSLQLIISRQMVSQTVHCTYNFPCSRHSRQFKVDGFKEDIVGGNIVRSHHLYFFLSQIMKQLYNLDGLTLQLLK